MAKQIYELDGTESLESTDLVMTQKNAQDGVTSKQAVSEIISLFNLINSSSVIADNALVRGDGGSRGIQDSGVILNDSDEISGLSQLTMASGGDILNAGGTPDIGDSSDPFGTGYFTKLMTNAGDTGGTASADADELVLEKDGDDCGITIISGSSKNCNIFMGDGSRPDIGQISYSSLHDTFYFRITSAIEVLKIISNAIILGSGKHIYNTGGTPDIGSSSDPFGTGYFTELNLGGSNLSSLQGGTANYIQKSDGSDGLTDSSVTDDGTAVTVASGIDLLNAGGTPDIGSSSDPFGTGYFTTLNLNGTDLDSMATETATDYWKRSSNATWTGYHTFEGNRVVIKSAAPILRRQETDASADEQFWQESIVNGGYNLYTANDALSSFNLIYKIGRSGATPTYFRLGSGVVFRNSGGTPAIGDATNPFGTVYTNGINLGDDDLTKHKKGSWTPTEANITFASASGSYIRIGDICYMSCDLTWPNTSDTHSITISLPFTAKNSGGLSISYLSPYTHEKSPITVRTMPGTATFVIYKPLGIALSNSDLSEDILKVGGTFEIN